MIKNVYWASCEVPVILVRFLMKPEFTPQIFEKYSNIKFHEILSGGIPVVPCKFMDRHDEGNSRFSKFCERALKRRNFTYFYTRRKYGKKILTPMPNFPDMCHPPAMISVSRAFCECQTSHGSLQ
jgi:hypothetical protein